MFIRSNAPGIKQSRAGPGLEHVEPVSQGADLRTYPVTHGRHCTRHDNREIN